MSNSYSNILPIIVCVLVALLIMLYPTHSYAQSGDSSKFNITPLTLPTINIKDSIQSLADTTFKKIKQTVLDIPKQTINKIKSTLRSTKNSFNVATVKNIDSTLIKSLNVDPIKNLFKIKPFFLFRGGLITYNMNYRSNIDTPFTEKNILQHNSYGNLIPM